jgi:hypothetical protein
MRGKYLIYILEGETAPVKDIFGQVSTRFICLTGLLLEATISTGAEIDKEFYFNMFCITLSYIRRSADKGAS